MLFKSANSCVANLRNSALLHAISALDPTPLNHNLRRSKIIRACLGKCILLTLIIGAQPWLCAASEIGRGKFLIANEALSDPNFDSTVVLIIGHDQRGTLGVVVNRRLETAHELNIPLRYQELCSEMPRYFGGPVPVAGLRALVWSEFTLPDSIQVMPSIYFLDNPQAFDYLLEDGDAIREARLYHGVASWIPGQLAAEIRAGAWYVIDATSEEVFSSDTALWEKLIAKIHATWADILPARDNPLPANEQASIMPWLSP